METASQVIFDFGILFTLTIIAYSTVSRSKFAQLHSQVLNLANLVACMEGELDEAQAEIKRLSSYNENVSQAQAQLRALQGDLFSRTRNIQDYEAYLVQNGYNKGR